MLLLYILQGMKLPSDILVHLGQVGTLILGSLGVWVAMFNQRRQWRRKDCQDLIEYALIAATLAVVVAGFLPPTIMPVVSTIFSEIANLLSNALF